METRRYAGTRQIIDINNVLSKDNECRIIVVRQSAIEILRKLSERAFWPVTYYSELHSGYYTIPGDDNLSVAYNSIADFLGETSMACTGIEQTLASIAGSLSIMASNSETSGCCAGGSSGAELLDDKSGGEPVAQGEWPPEFSGQSSFY